MPSKIQKFYRVSVEDGIWSAIRLSFRWLRYRFGLLRAAPPAGIAAPEIVLHVPAVAHVRIGDGRRVHSDAIDPSTSIPFPPLSLMVSVGAHSIRTFDVTGDAWRRLLQSDLRPVSTILDIGSGCGRVARWFVDDPKVAAYVGFDVIEESVEWCNHFLAPLAPGKFHFRHFDVHSAEYNPSGKINSCDLVFPLPDSAADIAFAASVFTHLLDDDSRHYLREISRVLKPDCGRAFISILRARPGTEHSGDEARMEFDEDYFIRMALENGLALHRRFGDVVGQDVLCMKKK